MRVGLGGLPFVRIWLGQAGRHRLGGPLHRRNESIALPGDCLYEMRLLGIVAQDLADLSYSAVDAVVSIEKNALPPNPFGDLVPANNLPSLFNEEEQNLQRNTLEFEHTSGTA